MNGTNQDLFPQTKREHFSGPLPLRVKTLQVIGEKKYLREKARRIRRLLRQALKPTAR